MARVWIYTLGASNDPDYVRCRVPWRVDDDLIFFGPCMPRIRAQLRTCFLQDCSHTTASEELFIVGINASNDARSRKIVWAGKLSQVMTFFEAYKRLKRGRFSELRDHPCSPLHVRPIIKNEQFVGYELVSEEHVEDQKWISDLVSNAAMLNIQVDGRKLSLRPGKTHGQGFDRDCCMLLGNIFFAQGRGLEFDEDALEIMRQAKSGIDRYAVFGRMSDGKANGLRGNYLEITGNPANRFVTWLKERSRAAAKYQRNDGNGPSKTRCA